MAKSVTVIRMEFNKANQQADKLDRLAGELRQLANDRFAGCLSEINNAWKSDSAAKYIKKGRQVQDEIRKRAKELENTAKAIRTIAKNTYNAEMQARQIARLRTYR